MSKRASEESPSDLPCPRIEGTFGFVFVTRGGAALGIARAGMVGSFETFYVALIGPFVKSYHLIYVHIISVLLVDKYQRG